MYTTLGLLLLLLYLVHVKLFFLRVHVGIHDLLLPIHISDMLYALFP